jgi:hypothetical protein
MDLLRRRHIGGSNRVVSELRYPQRTRVLLIADANRKDIVARVGLLRCCNRLQVLCETLPIEAPLKDLGVAYLPIRSIGVVHAVQCEGDGIEIALRHNSCRVDKVLILRTSRDWCSLKVGCGAQRLQVRVDDRVRLRQQPRGLWWSGLPQHQREGQRGDQRQHKQHGVAGTFTHQVARRYRLQRTEVR